MNRRYPITAMTLIGLVLGGCGAGSGAGLSTFKSGFAADKVRFRQLGTDLQTAITQAGSKTDVALASELSTLSVRARQQAAQLSKLDPPPSYRAGLNRLVSSLGAVGSDLKTMSAAARRHRVDTARAATRTLLHDATEVKSGDVALTSALHLPALS